MKMNKREYAQEIANIINEHEKNLRAEVVDANKPNGVVLTGINIREEGVTASPTIYVEQFYENKMNVYEAAVKITNNYYDNKMNIDIEWIQDYEQVKGKLVACLYNASNAEAFPVHQSAKRYGFDDLIITARIMVDLGAQGRGSIIVRPDLIERWGVTKAEVIRQALANVKKDCVIKTMAEILREMMPKGMADVIGIPDDEEQKMLVITNADRIHGAVAILNAKKELNKRFPNGYTVLPSSIHEVIVVGSTEDENAFTGMIGEVNDAEVDMQEQLSNHAYVFRREAV